MAIFIVRQVQEKFRAKKKETIISICRFGKAFDRVPREVRLRLKCVMALN